MAEPHKLATEKRALLESLANTIYVSAVSITEIMIKASLGKLTIDFDPVTMAEASGFELLAFSARDALPLQSLPYHHRDPFDRMLVAQSITREIPIMTEDRQIQRYHCTLI